MARTAFLVLSDIPTQRSVKVFYDFLIAGWALVREEPVGLGESVGIGFTWYSRVGEHGSLARLPRPWALVRNGLVERGAIHPKAHVWMSRSEVVRISRDGEQARLFATLERN